MRRLFNSFFPKQAPVNRRQRRARRKLQRQTATSNYDVLEDRNLLAVTALFSGGVLDIGLSAANEVATVTVNDDGFVAVNGDIDLNSGVAGVQSATTAEVFIIDVAGVAGVANQGAVLAGSFANLEEVEVTGVNDVNFAGSYNISDELNVVLDGADGGVIDTGVLVVQGTTSIDANNNLINLDNSNNNFIGAVSVFTDTFNSVVLADQNDIVFDEVNVNGDFIVSSGGTISDVAGSEIFVSNDAVLAAQSVVIGDNAADNVNFIRVNANTTGLFELHESGAIVIDGDNQWGSAILDAPVIVDSLFSNIDITGDGIFSGVLIRLGEHGTDTFNAGRINFNATGHVHFHENSSTTVFGNNVASTLNLVSIGDLTDAEDSVINVSGDVGVQATGNIFLGDTDTDVFNTGRLTYFSLQSIQITENTGVVIFDTQNFAQNLQLETNGSIVDTDTAQQLIINNATYISNGLDSLVDLGDTDEDRFTAGTISFNVQGDGAFLLEEDNDTAITNTSQANSSRIEAQGDITSQVDAIYNVATNASFIGDNIFLGAQDGDFFTFGSLTLTAPDGAAIVFEDIDPNEDVANQNLRFAGDSVVGSLRADSVGQLRDAPEATVNVEGFANLSSSDSIELGELSTDQFNAGALLFNSPGAVQIFEDSNIFFAGGDGLVNTALSTNFFAVGTIGNGQTASITVENLFVVAATGDINLGIQVDEDDDTIETDFLSFGQLSFRTLSASTQISADSNIDITGINEAIEFILFADGDITDGPIASITATSLAFFSGGGEDIDITIGDTDTDFFCILDPEGVLVADGGSGTVDIATPQC